MQPVTGEPGKRFPIVALGASAGGLEAFETFFKAMPSDSGIAFVLIAHLDPTHVSLLPELVQKRSSMRVHQVRDGMKVERNNVYVIPPNKNLTILNGILQLMDLTKPRGANLPIDSFFRSLAQDQGERAIGIVLSGTASYGTLGLRAIKEAGGLVVVQDPKSAQYDGMPHSAIATGLVDYVLPPDEMPARLIDYVQRPLAQIVRPGVETDDALQKIFILLRSQTGHDFSHYKEKTVYRRLARRLTINQIKDLEHYARYLQRNPPEADALFRELLIGVTQFFRDSEAFAALQEKVIPRLFENLPLGQAIRVWTPGCSTGEEVYSIAILLQEYMAELQESLPIQIFATDIDERAIETARAGVYPENIVTDVSPERLRRFFSKKETTYRVNKNVRDTIVFAVQSVVKDPPFSKLDLISCRNLLIY
ncbi:MAG: chemotaxis protein CheR, partial [Proteobacteria bacterium]|nr:chemotaxis protein CheR [Pseudomonadota bacterium]